MNVPVDLHYTREHEWAAVEGEFAVIGITDYAQEQLGDVVFVDLPEIGSRIEQTKKFGEIESVKAVSELYSPLSGEVVEVNDRLTDASQLVNDEPYEGGWMIRIRIADPAELDNLLSAEDYTKFLESGAAEH